MKIVTLKKLLGLRPHWRHQGLRVVFTNGCFDLIHLGHIRCLQKAKKAGDILVVGLNSDASVRKLKGPERPFLPEKERAEILSALEAVDYVVLFHDLTPIKLIKALQPDVLVKGAEYRDREVVGASLVRSYGGRILLVPMVPGSSTSILAARIRQKKVRKGKK